MLWWGTLLVFCGWFSVAQEGEYPDLNLRDFARVTGQPQSPRPKDKRIMLCYSVFEDKVF